MEVGAGLGALTDLLAASAKQVLAVEVDRTICTLLTPRLAALANVEVRCEDILTFPWPRYPGSKVIGAVPYHITSPLLVNLCEQATSIAGAWFGLQREVVQRLCATPGTKAYGRLTLLVQYYFSVKSLVRMPPTAFFPRPHVDSMWMQLLPRPSRAAQVEDEHLFFDVIRVAFSQRRKTLLNGLGQLTRPRLTREDAAGVIRQLGLPSQVRGEALSLTQFAQLANTLTHLKPFH